VRALPLVILAFDGPKSRLRCAHLGVSETQACCQVRRVKWCFARLTSEMLKLRLLFLAGGFMPIGGIEAFIRDLSTNLAAQGHQISVVCWGPESELLADIERGNVVVRRQGFRWGCRFAVPDILLAARFGVREISRHDAVIFTKIGPPPVLSLLRSVACHGKYRPCIYVTAYRPSEMWREVQPAAGTLNSFDMIMVQARGFESELRSFGYRGRVQTISLIPPHTVVPLPLPLSGGVIRIGFLGRLVPQKNVQYLMQAFARLAHGLGDPESSDRPSWELHIYGDGAEQSRLGDAAAARRLGASVHFHGAVPRESVPAAIDSCHLFAFSSVSEGQCLAALEILSRGRPIVATPVGAFPEILTVPELGAIAPLDDAEQFAWALMRVASQLRAGRLTPQATQTAFIRRFPRDEIIRSYCSSLTELVQAHGGSNPLHRRDASE
jgi:glycosyltransferase involved in cell wall biosynthesis